MFTIDRKISVGNILTIVTVLFAATGAYYSLQAKTNAHEVAIEKHDNAIEKHRVDINDGVKKSYELEKSIVRMEAHVVSINNILTRLEKTIDRLEIKK